MSRAIEFRWPRIPESVNGLYIPRGRSLILTTKGRKFKNEFISRRGGLPAVKLMDFEVDPDGFYQLELWFYLPRDQIFNKSFGQRKGTARCKKMDVSNLIKLIEDAISELLGIPDQNNFTVIAHKRVADGEPGLVARIQPLNLEDDPHALD